MRWTLGRQVMAIGIVALVLPALGCGEDSSDNQGEVRSASTSPSPTVGIAPTRPEGDAPDTWFAVEHRDGAFVLVRGQQGSEQTTDLAEFAADAGLPDTSIPVSVTDLAVAVDGNRAFVARCCEPVSGSIFEVALDGGGLAAAPAYRDQGRQVDAAGRAFVRADTVGVMAIDPDPTDPADQVSLVDASAIDVTFGTGDAVVALARAQGDVDTDFGSLVHVYSADGVMADELDLAAPHCAVTRTNEAIVTASGRPQRVGDELLCLSDRFTVIPLTDGADTLQLGAPAFDARLPRLLRDLESDASGGHLIGVDEDGNVVQVASDDTVQPLTAGRHFVAADW